MITLSTITGSMAILMALLPAAGAEECTATLSVNLTGEQDSLLRFQVMVSTSATRAQIAYNLLLTVATPSGGTRVVAKPRLVKIGVGTVFDIVTHRLGPNESLVGSGAELVSCRSQS